MNPRSASEPQIRAADPVQSTWLSANAGSGKTRVLIDRVARLLLGGTEPQRILCLTYTKAAASEMQNRLFDRLGHWAMLPEPQLRAALGALGDDGAIDAETLARARRLFARAIETPGGLKIQTIHSFCAGLLRRFPLEAGVAPGFVELDDRTARLLRDDILDEMAGGADVPAVDALAGLVGGEDLSGAVAAIAGMAGAFATPASGEDIAAQLGLAEGDSTGRLTADVIGPGDPALLAALIPLLRTGGKRDGEAADKLAAAPLTPPTAETLAVLEDVLLYGAKAKAGPFAPKIGEFPSKALREGAAVPLMPGLEALMQRVGDGRERRLALLAAARSAALHQFAGAFLPRYRARKAAQGWLDFDDLIVRSAQLLADPEVAAWVLFRLDGGIDHILVDEAQDTSPAQWQVIERLAEEFTAGAGARDARRTVFVVGDKKQSIYSFQGADLAAFDAMRRHFAQRFREAAIGFQELDLEYSFRSSEAILRVVDLTFDDRVNRGLGGEPKHFAFRGDLPGRVDLWPAVPKTESPEPGHWYDPVDLPSDEHHAVILSRRIAGELRRLIDAGTVIATRDGPKRLDEGDVLILVQGRQGLFHEIIRACKSEGLEIAGADRLRIGGELAVKDLTALLRFLATPEDDLSLAAALRSPLFGWSEGALFDLAAGREGYLWAALRGTGQEHGETLAILNDLRDAADFLRPHELIERMLTRHGGRKRLVARLGPEAEDGIDALLNEALGFERANVPSLTGFLIWMDSDEVEIKRRPDTATRAIRVMTVHGAKGLEAPVVILPDTAKHREDVRGSILAVDGCPLWKPAAGDSPARLVAARAAMIDRQREERMRLLYVAMTRAEVWLIVCGAGDVGQGDESWYGLIADAVEKAGAVDIDTGSGPGRRHEHGLWPAAPAKPPAETGDTAALPDWALTRPPMPAPAGAPLSPSGLGGAKALAGEGLDEAEAKRRGSALHLLLEHLPELPEAGRPAIAAALLAPLGIDAEETGPLLAEAERVLSADSMQPLLVPGALSEVELTAPVPELGGRVLHGTIDRLIVGPEVVLAVDYKSNAVVPARPDEVPEGILRQMGAYAAMLGAIYPDRRIETAILWTRTGRLMPLPHDIVRRALCMAAIP